MYTDQKDVLDRYPALALQISTTVSMPARIASRPD
jgi:hypothetical protein